MKFSSPDDIHKKTLDFLSIKNHVNYLLQSLSFNLATNTILYIEMKNKAFHL